MLNVTNKKPIKIAILGASTQNIAVLEFFFSNAGKSVFKKASIDDADVYIFDYDYPGAKDSWEALSAETNKPAITISIKEHDLPSTIWVSKPIVSSSLISAADSIRDLIQDDIQEPTVIIKPQELTNIEEFDSVNASVKEEVQSEQKSLEKELSKSKKIPELALAGDFDDENAEFEFEALAEPSPSLKVDSQDEPMHEVILEDDNVSLDEINLLDIDDSDGSDEEEVSNQVSSDLDMLDFGALEETSLEEPSGSSLDLEVTTKEESSLSFESSHEDEAMLGNIGISKNEDSIDLHSAKVDDEGIELSLESIDESSNSQLEAVEEAIDDTAIDLTVEDVPELTTEITAAESFLVAPNLITVDEGITSKVDESEDTIVVAQSVNDEEIDSLLEALISGGQRKANSDIAEDFDDQDIIEAVEDDIAPISHEHTDKTDDDFISIELEPVINEDTDLFVDVDESSSLKASPVVIDDATSVLVDNYSPDSDALLTSTEPTPDTIGEELYLDSTEDASESQPSNTTFSKKTAEEELQALLDELKEEAESSSDLGGGSGGATGEKNASLVSGHMPTVAEGRWALTCGSEKSDGEDEQALSSDQSKPSVEPIDSEYILSNHMLSALQDVIEQSEHAEKVMRLKFKGHIIVVDYASDFIYCDNSIFSDSYAKVCSRVIDEAKIKIHELDKSEVRLYQTKKLEDPSHFHTIEAFVWTTSLLTSQGRLLKYTDVEKKVGLKYWPNLTRLEQFPHAMQIAAVFYKHPGSLTEITKWLGIEERYIFAFYNAALSLDLIELDSSKINSSSMDLKTSSKKNTGFFSRLLKRITS